ncbi:nuclear GTP-binding protein, partial [Phenoliferia sp. Uapishka_3]
MPKIRKKTSRRTTTHMATKIKHKVSESHRKAAKKAKKDVTWKSNKPKDIGIPNSFPFKDQILAEQAAEKIRDEEEKIARREAQRAGNATGATLASTAALAQALAADSQRLEDEMAEEMAENGGEALVADASLKLHAKSLRKVLEASDVLIEVLDARDPVGTRCRAVERELRSLDGGRKKLILVLNKIDLVPPPVVQAWLAHLRLQAPTIAFKSSTQQQRTHLSASSLHTPNSASGSSTKPLMELIKGFRNSGAPNANSTEPRVKQSLTIGLIGHPNVGKSSLINTLKRSKACSVAPTPGWTKEVQEVVLEKGVRVLDCPGVVVEARGETEGALRGMVKPEEVRDPKAPIELILQRCKREHLMMLYNIPAFDGVTEFLVEVARGKGRLKKGGIPDINGTARSILRDWVSGRIPYYTTAPTTTASSAASTSAINGQQQLLANVTSEDVGGATLLSSYAPAFDLAGLFGEADAIAFGDASASSALKGVRMDGIEDDGEDANVGWAMGEEDESDLEVEMDDVEDDGLNVDDLLEDDDNEMDEDEEVAAAMVVAPPPPAPKAAKGKKRAAPGASAVVSVAPASKKSKSVSFASKALGPTGSGTTTPTPAAVNAKAIATEEASIGANKSIKKAAKKDKKKAAKKAAEVMEVEKEHGSDAEMPSKPRGSRVVSGAKGGVEEAYDFAEFFGKKPAATEAEEEL